MTNDFIRVDYAALQEIGSIFDQSSERVQLRLDSLIRHTDALKHGGWTGDAASRCLREMDEDIMPSLGRLVEALAAAGETTRQIAGIMREAEEQAAACLRPDLEIARDEKDDGRLYSPYGQDDVPILPIGEIGVVTSGDADTEEIDLSTNDFLYSGGDISADALLGEETSVEIYSSSFTLPSIITEAENGQWEQALAQLQNRTPLEPAPTDTLVTSFFSQRARSGMGVSWEEAVAMALLAMLGGGLLSQAAAMASVLAQEGLRRLQEGGFTLLPEDPRSGINEGPRLNEEGQTNYEDLPAYDDRNPQIWDTPLYQHGLEIESIPMQGEQGALILEAQTGDIQSGPSGRVTTTSNGDLAIEFDDGTIVIDNGPAISHEEAFDVAARWVGSDSYEYPPNSHNHYSQTQPDGTVHRFRMTDSDINAPSGAHINLEVGQWLQNRHGGWYFNVTQNVHVRIGQ